MVFGKTINPQANFMKARLNIMIGGLRFLGPIMNRSETERLHSSRTLPRRIKGWKEAAPQAWGGH
jgi:hypothetical protein